MISQYNLDIIHSFHEHLSAIYPYVKKKNWNKLEDISIVKHLEKDEMLLKNGDTLQYGIFVVEGWIKFSYIDQMGNERISTFCGDNEYIDNWNDMHQQKQLPYSISALSSTIVILYPLNRMIDIFKNESDLLQLCVDLSQAMIKKKQEHYEILTLKTPLERYFYLENKHKSWLRDVSLTNLAKYLHISREALSRARASQYCKNTVQFH